MRLRPSLSLLSMSSRSSLLLLLLTLWWRPAAAQAPCTEISEPMTAGERAAQLACAEHQLWRTPFINAQGQLLKIGPMEGERDALTDGSPAWQRVLHYWQQSVGLNDLFRHSSPPEYDDAKLNTAMTRTQIIDTPWSGAFISYVLKQAGVPESAFHYADGHIRYIKPAFTHQYVGSDAYAYTPRDPYRTRLHTGDLLCYVRDDARVWGVEGFGQWMNAHHMDEQSLKTHCDIVVGVQRVDKQQRAYTIGGNVVQSVTMRELTLNRDGSLSRQYALSVRSGKDKASINEVKDFIQTDSAVSCSMTQQAPCNMNRQDWVVLLQFQITQPSAATQ